MTPDDTTDRSYRAVDAPDHDWYPDDENPSVGTLVCNVENLGYGRCEAARFNHCPGCGQPLRGGADRLGGTASEEFRERMTEEWLAAAEDAAPGSTMVFDEVGGVVREAASLSHTLRRRLTRARTENFFVPVDGDTGFGKNKEALDLARENYDDRPTLAEWLRQRHRRHLTTTVRVHGTPGERGAQLAARRVAEVARRDDAETHWFARDELGEFSEGVKAVREGDVLVIELGMVYETNPPILRTLAHYVSIRRDRPAVMVFVTRATSDYLDCYVDVEVEPDSEREFGASTASVHTCHGHPYDPEAPHRRELAPITLEDA